MAVFCVCMLGAVGPANADERYAGDAPSGAAMAADVLVVRPLGLVATVAGTGIFLVSLPFSLLGSNTGDAAKQLVARPGAYTFVRPLGEFRDALEAHSR